MGHKVRQALLAVTVAVTLPGCMSTGMEMPFDMPFGKGEPEAEVARAQPQGAFAAAQDDRQVEHRSDIIDSLISRRSILPPGSSYAEVADAALAASSRTAEAELRQARLRAKAADKNWLPTLGPQVSLVSLSSFVAGLVVDQVLFDNGRKLGEREFARADVEAAAVSLSQDQNDRVHEALSLYIDAEEAREKAAAASGALTRMQRMEGIMAKRVQGGISDMSELSVIRAKVSELASTKETAERAERTARAELAAMTARPVSGVSGITPLSLPSSQVTPLTVELAAAEEKRDVAQAKIARAGFLPGLSAGASLSNRGGLSGPDVRLSSDSGFGFATGDNLKAVEASKEAAGRRVAQTEEDTRRRLAALREKRAGHTDEAARAAGLAEQGRANANLFKRQFEAGTRKVSEVVGVIETMARLDHDAIRVKYAGARTDIEIARELGLLADGSDV